MRTTRTHRHIDWKQRLLLTAPVLLFLLLLCSVPTHAQEEEEKKSDKTSSNQFLDFSVNDAPTYIQSKRLILFSEQRLVKYIDDVHVMHEGMDLKCDELEAYYNENDDIDRLIAKKNVYITKGETIRARSEKAVYEQKTEIMTLTENPELQQEKSVLAADVIRIFLNEDRSEAEGDVRVKLIDAGTEDEDKEKKDGKTPQQKKKNRLISAGS